MDGTNWAALALAFGGGLATLLLTSLGRLAVIMLEYLHGRLAVDLESRRASTRPPPPTGGTLSAGSAGTTPGPCALAAASAKNASAGVTPTPPDPDLT